MYSINTIIVWFKTLPALASYNIIEQDFPILEGEPNNLPSSTTMFVGYGPVVNEVTNVPFQASPIDLIGVNLTQTIIISIALPLVELVVVHNAIYNSIIGKNPEGFPTKYTGFSFIRGDVRYTGTNRCWYITYWSIGFPTL